MGSWEYARNFGRRDIPFVLLWSHRSLLER
jgi:hypothetical protein